MSAHNIRVAVERIATEIAERVGREEYERAERNEELAQIPPGHDFGRAIVKRHAEQTLLDWLLGDFKLGETK